MYISYFKLIHFRHSISLIIGSSAFIIFNIIDIIKLIVNITNFSGVHILVLIVIFFLSLIILSNLILKLIKFDLDFGFI